MFGLLFSTLLYANPWPDVSATLENRLGQGRSQDWALIVSIEDYDKVSDIAGAKQNGQDWYLWLTDSMGLPEDRVQWIPQENAYKTQIEKQAMKIGSSAKPGGFPKLKIAQTSTRVR